MPIGAARDQAKKKPPLRRNEAAAVKTRDDRRATAGGKLYLQTTANSDDEGFVISVKAAGCDEAEVEIDIVFNRCGYAE